MERGQLIYAATTDDQPAAMSQIAWLLALLTARHIDHCERRHSGGRSRGGWRPW